LKEISMVFLSY